MLAFSIICFLKKGFSDVRDSELVRSTDYITDAGNRQVLNIRKSIRLRKLRMKNIVSVHISVVCRFLVSRATTKLDSWFDSQPC